MTYQLLLRSPSGEQRVAVDRPLVVGRDPACDVPLESGRVSRRHAEFFPTPQGVGVRDLGSRNGVIVNGTRVDEAVLGAADRVLLGDVAVTVSVQGGASAGHLTAPPPPASPEAGSPFSSPDAQPDGAADAPPYIPPPPPAPPPAVAQSYGQPAWAQPGPAMPAADKTAILSRDGLLAAVAPGSVGAPGAHVGAAPRPKGRLGLGARLTLGGLAGTFLAFLVTAVPLAVVHRDVVQRNALARAATIVRALGAENGAALAAGQTLSVGVQIAMLEPGVREALLVGASGRVLAPADRAGEAVSRIEPFGDLSQIRGLLTASMAGEVHAVSAIESGGRQLGFVWVRLDPAYAGGGAPLTLFLGAALVFSLACGFGIAVALRRMVSARLGAFATDIDLAASGQLEAVTESLGVPRLAESVNFIVSRLRREPPQAAPRPPGPGWDAGPGPGHLPAAMPAPVQTPPQREGCLVLDASFVIREATPGAVEILKLASESLVGRHVLEAVTDQALVNAMIDGIGDLGPKGTATRRVQIGMGAESLDLHAERDADGSIRITIRRVK